MCCFPELAVRTELCLVGSNDSGVGSKRVAGIEKQSGRCCGDAKITERETHLTKH